jgi:deoxyribose-phosphate aldolase
MHGTSKTIPHAPAELAPFIDHTLLKADASQTDIDRLCEEAAKFKFKAVCVNPIFVRRTRERLSGSLVLTASVIGFPLGASLSLVKARETELAARDGASEIDMVMRLDLAKAGLWAKVQSDINEVVRAAPEAIVKVILETGLLTPQEIVHACHASEQAGAHFVKTATGFIGRGATLEDIELMRKSCSANMQIKASGGIKSFAQAKAMIEAGATRIGTSSGVSLVNGDIPAPTGY